MSQYIIITRTESKKPTLEWEDAGRLEIASAIKQLSSNVNHVDVSSIHPAPFLRTFDLSRVPPYQAIFLNVETINMFGYYFIETDQPIRNMDYLLNGINEISPLNKNVDVFHISQNTDPKESFEACFDFFSSDKDQYLNEALDVFKCGVESSSLVESMLKEKDHQYH